MQLLKSLFARTAASLGFVTRPIASPTRASELQALKTANPGCKFPAAKRHRRKYYEYNPQWFKRAAA